MGEFDYAAVACMLERVYNRTYFEDYTISTFNDSIYQSLPHVSFKHICFFSFIIPYF